MYNIEDKPITIKKNVESKDGLDFNFLKEKGIEYIEQLGRKLWTNYNLSDSGIAFLEVFIYGITDLELRIKQPIQDILTSEQDVNNNFKKQFNTAKNILTTAPVTEIDYRKLFIDIPGVKNIWIEKYNLPIYVECNPDKPKYSFKPIEATAYKTGAFNIKGLYTLMVEFEEKGVNKIEIFNKIIDKYHENRNLCEDIAELKVVPNLEIKVCANIQIESEANEEFIDAQIQFAIENYFSPHVSKYSLSEMLDKGIATEDIFNGPQLFTGFMDDEELIVSQLGKDVRLSDIINIIMGINGVEYIEDIQLLTINKNGEEKCCCDSSKEAYGDDWIICIPDGVKASFNKESNLQYKKGYIGVQISEEAERYLEELRTNAYKNSLKSCDDLPLKTGEYNDLSSYWSIQNDLPENFGVGENILPSTNSKERKIQAKQLKAYLLLMEQVLATYFSQLGNLSSFFSTDKAMKSNYVPNEKIQGIHNLDELVGSETDYLHKLVDEFQNAENFTTRRNDILNHLFARFAENFSAYNQAMSKLKLVAHKEHIDNKNDFLDNYASYSYRRNLAMNYYEQPIWNANSNLSGIQEKIAYTIGLGDKRRRCLFPNPVEDNMQEGMFAIENILILPTKKFAFDADLASFTTIKNVSTDDYYWKVKLDERWYQSTNEYESKELAYEEFISNLNVFCEGLEKKEVITGRYQLVINQKNEELGSIIEVVYAQSLSDYNDSNANKIIDSFDIYKAADAFDFCCFKYEFIDKTVSLEFSECAMPCIDYDCNTCSTADFFSYRMSFVFPGWTERFRDIGFRSFMENLIYDNLPAHILPRICWVGDKYEDLPIETDTMNDIDEISQKWKSFLDWKSDKLHSNSAYFSLANNLLCRMNHLNNIYDEGYFYDCEKEEEEQKFKKIILNQTTLGTLKTE